MSGGQGIALAMINIAIMYRSSIRNYDLALYYDKEALKLMREIGNKKGESHALGNIRLTFSEKGDYKYLSGQKTIQGSIGLCAKGS